jgi:ABC-2 type transport system permease protein
VPGLVGVILTMTMVMLTAMAIARERERGTLEQLIVSPVRGSSSWSARSCPTC